MANRIGSSLVLLLLAAGCGFSQIGFPGQYPGSYPGQYPPNQGGGIPIPGGGRRTTTRPSQDNQAPTQTLTGMLRKISSTKLALESDDKRIITISLADATRYSDASSNANLPKTAKRTDFQPGDHLSIDATQDNDRYYHATKVTLAKRGTAEERAKASEPLDSWPSADQDPPAASPSSRPAPASRDSDDAYRPSLQRGSPGIGPIANAQPPAVPDARPSIQAQEQNGVTRLPEPPQIDRSEPSQRPASILQQKTDGDPIIENAREAAFSFSETLPNYVVKQVTTRFATEAAHGGHTSWQPIDNVTADVVSEGGVEKYKNILVNGKPPKDSIEKTGSWSTGEYATVLRDILSPVTNADFHNKRSTTIVNRPAFRYDYTVAQQNSHWHVFSSAESYTPEFTGSIWIDKETFRALRIELSARNFPAKFPLDTVESATDYDFVLIGGNKYLLPVHSEALSCVRGTGECSRNVIDFRNYKKFGAETSITFEPDR